MRVFGTVKDSKTEVPIKGARVTLSIGEKELAILYTDSKGEFEHSSPESYIGEILTFYAEKKGYESQRSTYEIEGEEVPFDIELVPIIVDSWWKKFKRWIVANKKWIAIGAGIIVVVIILIKLFIHVPNVGGKKSDLIISRIDLSPANPTVEDIIKFRVYVKNIGSYKAGQSKLSFRIGGESNPPITVVPPLAPNQEYVHTRESRLSVAQNYRVTAITDVEKDVNESNENNNVGTKDFKVVKPYVLSSGSVTIHGTYSCDLDLGRETQTDADFFWQQATSTKRYITPRNGAKFHVLGIRDFNSITYSYLSSLSYSTQQIDGSNTSSNKIPQGTVVAAITSKGNYCKFRINTYGYNLYISWVTYSAR